MQIFGDCWGKKSQRNFAQVGLKLTYDMRRWKSLETLHEMAFDMVEWLWSRFSPEFNTLKSQNSIFREEPLAS